jgi:hypothetical protein
MSAPHHTQLYIPSLSAYGQLEDEFSIKGTMDAYLRCEDLRLSPSTSKSARFAPDDISILRAAHRMAVEIRAIEASEGTISAAAKRNERIMGSALVYVIQQCDGRLREVPPDQYETIGQFHDLIVQFVIHRIRNSSSLALYARMEGIYWTNTLQCGVMSSIEQLWDVSLMVGLVKPDNDMALVSSLLHAMATIYTVAWLGNVDMDGIDVTKLDFVVRQLSCRTMKVLAKGE